MVYDGEKLGFFNTEAQKAQRIPLCLCASVLIFKVHSISIPSHFSSVSTNFSLSAFVMFLILALP